MNYRFLSKIEKTSDIKKYSAEQLGILCDEIRHKLITTVSKNGCSYAQGVFIT